MNFLLPLLLGLGGHLLGSIFGGNRSGGNTTTSEQETQTTTPRLGYQSPWLGLMDTQMADMMTRMMGAYGGAGMPGGVGFRSPFNESFLEAIASSIPGLLEGYQGQAATVPSATSTRPKTTVTKDMLRPPRTRPGYPPSLRNGEDLEG